jgi:hypothetical protein
MSDWVGTVLQRLRDWVGATAAEELPPLEPSSGQHWLNVADEVEERERAVQRLRTQVSLQRRPRESA